ncbi:YdgH/BhsA/McbA family protein [Serratia rubidaea]|uniref:DUF1471 domain-containing protein n=1 Tax=Serratia rubidaea TaxID=61652 RepID=UPI00178661A7|nr:DUF1471 domain-containing protein [Serratia rubidaea]MBD8450816.1 DUF1471 domain-containing protein [Serratia rubidaea]
MKYLSSYLTAALLAGASFSALAAPLSVTAINNQQAAGLQSLGAVSVSGVAGTSDDAVRKLQEKAADQGASHYRIIGLDTPGDSSLWRGNAEIYR